MSGATGGRPASCGELAMLPESMVWGAIAYETTREPGRQAEPEHVRRDLTCMLESHAGGEHFALVLDLHGPDTGSVWARWTAGARPELVVLKDCNSAHNGEPCCSFSDHPGAHTYDLFDAFDGGALPTITP